MSQSESSAEDRPRHSRPRDAWFTRIVHRHDARSRDHRRCRCDSQAPEKTLSTALIVQVRVTNKEVREYVNGRKGVKQTFHLMVVDRATWTKVDERSFDPYRDAEPA